MADQCDFNDIDSKPTIKIEVKEEYEENSFFDAGCSFDGNVFPHSNDGEIQIKAEPCDFEEECKNSVKLEIKEEFPGNDSGKIDFLSLSASQDPHPVQRLDIKKLKRLMDRSRANILKHHKLKMKFLQEEYELKKKILEAKQAYNLAIKEYQQISKPP